MLRIATLVLLTAAASTATVAVLAGPASAHVPTCQASQLVPHYAGRDGTAGTFHDEWRLQNFGATCQLRGWVSVQNFGAQGIPMPMRTHHSAGPATAIDLRTNQHASFTLSYADPGISGCTPEHPSDMTIRLPGTAGEVLAEGRGASACSGRVDISPMVRGG
jgi:hypothetical protein